MAQSHKTRLDRLELRAGGGGQFLIVMESPAGALTHNGEPWSEDLAGALDTVLIIKSFVGDA